MPHQARLESTHRVSVSRVPRIFRFARRASRVAFFTLILCTLPSACRAEPIYVIGSAGDQGQNAIATDLSSFGNTVTIGGQLSDYSAYREVWDTNYADGSPISAAEKTYLQSGGRMFLAGELSGFDPRKNAIVNFVSNVGGGQITLVGEENGTNAQTETFTTRGQILNSPVSFSSIQFPGTRTVSITNTGGSDGFLAMEAHPNVGSVLAWDFGGITSSQSSRLITIFDLDFVEHVSPDWINDMAVYLDAPATVTPAPASLVLLGTGLPVGFGLIFLQERRRLQQTAGGVAGITLPRQGA
jgi:hypothetical protein